MLETNYKFGEVQNLASQIEAEYPQPKAQKIFGNDNGGVALVAFKAGQKLDEHLSPAEVMVYVVEGEIEFTMIDSPNAMKAGDFLLMGADVPHSVLAKTDAKIALIKVKP